MAISALTPALAVLGAGWVHAPLPSIAVTVRVLLALVVATLLPPFRFILVIVVLLTQAS